MKPFDLDLVQSGHPIRTRDGRPARIICYDRLSEHYPIIGLVKSGYDNPEEVMYAFTKDGRASIVGPTDSDLFMGPGKKEGWINIYDSDKAPTGREGKRIFESKEEAYVNRCCVHDWDYITTVKIEWEE